MEEVNEISELCPHLYGDVVYWARGILDHLGEIRSYDDESCDSDLKEGVSPRVKESSSKELIIVSPNPTSNYVTIKNESSFNELEVNLTDSYGKDYDISDKLYDQLVIDY